MVLGPTSRGRFWLLVSGRLFRGHDQSDNIHTLVVLTIRHQNGTFRFGHGESGSQFMYA